MTPQYLQCDIITEVYQTVQKIGRKEEKCQCKT